MPASQPAASERRTDKMITPEPPKLKTTLKTPPKQATNPLQFVKVGPCALYRTAQEQLQKVEEVKKIKQEVREDPEDWQSNLDNWKSSRRKRQEHIIERVVEVKKLELVEHDRQRRRSKTFSEMMEERGNRGRKMSVGLAVYHEEDANDFSDLGIGTSSGKSSVSGDTHDDAHSVLSDRDSEIEKNHSDVDNAASENGNNRTNATTFENEFHNNRNHNQQEYDSATTATASSPEPEEYTYEGAIRGYVSRVSQNIPRRSLAELDNKVESSSSMSKEKVSKTELSDETKGSPVVKVDILKRREIFEKGSQQSSDGKSSRLSGDFTSSKSIKERLSNLEKQKNDGGSLDKSNKNLNRLSGDMSSIRERLSHLEKKTTEREMKNAKKLVIDSNGELDNVRPLRERLSTLERYSSGDESTITAAGVTVTSRESRHNGDFSVTSIKDRLSALDAARNKEIDKRTVAKHTLAYRDNETRIETSTPSERSSSPDSEYRVPRAPFHRSLDSLDADASSGPDTFERVQSLEELDYTRRYPASSSSTELLNDTDREDSGIHTADVSCSVSQADEPVDDEIVLPVGRQEIIEEKPEPSPNDPETEHTPENVKETHVVQPPTAEPEIIIANNPESATQKETSASLDIVQESNRVTSPVEIPHLSHDRDLLPEVDHTQNEPAKLASAPEAAASEEVPRPLTLTFGKASLTAEEMEILSPLSPTSKQILTLNLSSDEEIVTSSLAFPLGPPTSVEPPKEKPPPPPADLSDEEGLLVEPLRRLNSTRRIKKELRTRRSDFLGIEGGNDEDLERELTIAKPPDMAAILAEERRVEQLHRRSYDTDSNYEQDSSHERDSGVELGHAEDWNKQTISPDMSQHSRQSSEPFGASVTSSEEDEITKKEREIIEVLEKEEQWRYGNTGEANSDIIGEKLAHKLRELEEEKMQLERERAQEVELRRQEDTLRKNEENIRKQEKALRKREADTVRQEETAAAIAEAERRTAETRCVNEQVKAKEEPEEKERWNAETRPRDSEVRLRTIENQIRDQENKALGTDLGDLSCHEDEYASGEVLRVERELLQLEQEELKRQRSNLAYREQKQQKLAEQLREQWKSMQDVVQAPVNTPSIQFKALPPVNYRSSMPNLEDSQRRKLPPPPIPPAKPLRLVEQRQRDVTIRSSRMPSADSIPQQVDASLRHSASATTLSNHAGQQMTRQTLQALSAAPRPRIVQGDQWVQRRKSDVPRGAQDMNYQHWLIQEAEQRRINEQNLRSPRKVQSYVTGTSVPYSMQCASPRVQDNKPLPDSIIQTLTQRVQNRAQEKPLPPRRRLEHSSSHEHISTQHQAQQPLQPQQQRAQQQITTNSAESQEKMLSVSGKKKCSHCGDELGRGAAMIIESLRLFYHMECFKCCVCHVRLGDGRMGTDVRVRNHKLHCHNCYSSDDGVKFSCV
ncbi:LIM domain only protein 7 isoform X3 [Neodiprion virginianus]|uniref:LIM domain only protein 7 isoform X3 n=1 Tax=Neodiprion virginianus TaxID=2961670 RepID=UPI001EE6FCB2|nr:LIM domain only protein 7 isoform X3 [Neodiprion virginianus]